MRKSKYTKEILEPIVNSSISLSQVLKKLNLTSSGGNYRLIKQRIMHLNLDISHFKGQGWAKGQTEKTNESILKVSKINRYCDEIIFSKNSPASNSSLRRRIIKNNLIPYICSEKDCNITSWKNKPLTLHLDHINGVSNDNRLENLRFLCPNCHQQTETWGCNKKSR